MIGGSAGIGLETARRARAEGADVILTGRDPGRLERAATELGAVGTAAFDANDSDAPGAFFGRLEGPIDHVMVTARRPVLRAAGHMDFDEGRRALQEHPMLMVGSRPLREGRPGGTLLFIGGTGGRRPGRHRAHRGADRGAPGAHRQPGARARTGPGQPDRRRVRRHAAVGVAARRPARRRRDELRATLPIGRVVGPADVAALAVHIMTNTALTGATYDIDGGQQLVAP